MSDEYTHTLTIAVPLALVRVANRIARAIDPDSGGERSFDVLRATAAGSSEPTHAVCVTRVTTEMACEVAMVLGYSVAGLQHACAMRYAERFEALEPPTLAECSDFFEHARWGCDEYGSGLDDLLPAWGLCITR